MQPASHPIRAFALAPLVVPFMWCAFSAVSYSVEPQFDLGAIALVVICSLPWIYGATLFVGLPAYLLIRRWSDLKAWHTLVVGAVLGALVLPMTENLPGGTRRIAFGAFLGLSAGLMFWLLWRPRPNTPLQRTGLAPRR